MQPRKMQQIIDRKRYNTETATLLAGDDYWDGHNFERHGRQCFLYKTSNGSFFAVHLTQWQGELNHIEPLSQDEAVSLYESLREKRVEFEEAFPGVELADA